MAYQTLRRYSKLKFIYFIYLIIIRPTTLSQLYYTTPWPVIHLVVFLISGQGYFTYLYIYAKNNRESRRKEQTNKHELGSAPRARRREVYVTFFVHSVFLWANASVYSSENSHKATSNADLTSRVGPPSVCGLTGLSNRLSDFYSLVSSLPCSHLPDWPVLSTVSFCSLLLTGFFRLLSDVPSLVLPVSWEISRVGPLYGFRAKRDKRILWLAPAHTLT